MKKPSIREVWIFSEATQYTLLLPLDGMQVVPTICFASSFIHLGGESNCENSVLSKKQCNEVSLPGLKPRLLNPESGMLAVC